MPNKKLSCATFSLFAFLFLIIISTAQAAPINTTLPTTYSVVKQGPVALVAGFYDIGLLVGGILAFGAIVYGGIVWTLAGGNSSKVSEGRSWITGAVIGLLLLLGAFLVLHTINPALTTLTFPKMDQLNVPPPGSPNPGGGSPGPRCQAPASGPCSAAQFQGSCFSNPQLAEGVCNVESSGNPNNQGDKGVDGHYNSFGLFQINISANPIRDPSTGQMLDCPSAFDYPYSTKKHPDNHVIDQALYQKCVAAAKNPSSNLQEACLLSNGGANWGLWGPDTRKACGL